MKKLITVLMLGTSLFAMEGREEEKADAHRIFSNIERPVKKEMSEEMKAHKAKAAYLKKASDKMFKKYEKHIEHYRKWPVIVTEEYREYRNAIAEFTVKKQLVIIGDIFPNKVNVNNGYGEIKRISDNYCLALFQPYYNKKEFINIFKGWGDLENGPLSYNKEWQAFLKLKGLQNEEF